MVKEMIDVDRDFWTHVQLKEMDDVDMLTLVIQEMSKRFPTLMETLVHERDQLVSYAKFTLFVRNPTFPVASMGNNFIQSIKLS